LGKIWRHSDYLPFSVDLPHVFNCFRKCSY
jgi:hypothetical protein